MKKEKCHCCGYYTLTSEDLVGEMCPVCFWEYDRGAQTHTTIATGPNHGVSLVQAQENYKKHGVYDLQYKSRVRPPLPEELSET